MLSAVAATGFDDLTARLHQATGSDDADAVADYGEVYVEFALERAALFDLMFGSPDLRQDDPELVSARNAALLALDAAARPDDEASTPRVAPVSDATLVRWAFAHGVAVLLRTGALQRAADDRASPAQLARHLITAFTAEVRTD